MTRGLGSALVSTLLACVAPSVQDDPSPEPRTVAPAPAPEQAEDIAEAEAEPEPAPVAPASSLQLVFVGDVIVGRYGVKRFVPIVSEGEDPFAGVADLLAGDVLVGNLETPLVRKLPARSPIHIGYRFGGEPPDARMLAKAGFTAMSVANNHSLDLLADGLEQTPTVLEEAGIVPVGRAVADGAPIRIETVEKRGWRLGLVSVTTYLNTRPEPGQRRIPLLRMRRIPDRVLPVVAEARDRYDLVIVLVHWGQEFQEASSWRQRQAARALIDGGVDLVIGHHPHILQGLEHRKGGLIAYSLGNFLFIDQGDPSRDTGVLRVRFVRGDSGDRPCLEHASFHPVTLSKGGKPRPRPARGAHRRRINRRMQKLGVGLSTKWASVDGALERSNEDCKAADVELTPPT